MVAPLDPDLLIGEMCFVPNPQTRAAEDDGILMGYGYHRGRDEGQLLLLDAQTLRVGGNRASAAAGTDGLSRQLGFGLSETGLTADWNDVD